MLLTSSQNSAESFTIDLMKNKATEEATGLRIGDRLVIAESKKTWTVAVFREGAPLEIADDQFILHFVHLRGQALDPIQRHNYAHYLARSVASIAGLEDRVEENFTLTKEGHHQFLVA